MARFLHPQHPSIPSWLPFMMGWDGTLNVGGVPVVVGQIARGTAYFPEPPLCRYDTRWITTGSLMRLPDFNLNLSLSLKLERLKESGMKARRGRNARKGEGDEM